MKTKILIFVMMLLSGMAYADNSGVILDPKAALLAALKDCVGATTADAKAKAEAALTSALAAYAASLPPGTNVRGAIIAFVAAYSQGLSVDQANALFDTVSEASPPGSNMTPEVLAKTAYDVGKKKGGENPQGTTSPAAGPNPGVPGGTSGGGSVPPTLGQLIPDNKIVVEKGKFVPAKPVSSSGMG